jgi:hypothetical protein
MLTVVCSRLLTVGVLQSVGMQLYDIFAVRTKGCAAVSECQTARGIDSRLQHGMFSHSAHITVKLAMAPGLCGVDDFDVINAALEAVSRRVLARIAADLTLVDGDAQLAHVKQLQPNERMTVRSGRGELRRTVTHMTEPEMMRAFSRVVDKPDRVGHRLDKAAGLPWKGAAEVVPRMTVIPCKPGGQSDSTPGSLFSRPADWGSQAAQTRENIQPDGTLRCPHPGCTYTCAGDNLRYLTVHQRTHSVEQPFVCDFAGCGYKAERPDQVMVHKRIHSGEKLFVCDFAGCDYKAAQSYQVTRHKRSHH